MKTRLTRRPASTLLLFLCLLLFPDRAAAQSAPPAYVLSDGERAVIILGDTPQSLHSFQVYRRGPGEAAFRLVTPEPIQPADDPYEAMRLMGDDYDWIARKMESIDPSVVWRKLRLNRSLAQAYALLSPGLRAALGRTWIDGDVVANNRYRYRIVFYNAGRRELRRYERAVTITEADAPPAPSGFVATHEDGIVEMTWEYPAFTGGHEDLTVGFIIYRKCGSGDFAAMGEAPILRIEDYRTSFDDDVEIGETYTYGIVAVDIIGTVSERVVSAPVAIEDTRAPLVPVGLNATDRGADVLVIWKMSPELDVTHYNLYRSLSVDQDAELIKLNEEPVPAERPRFVDEEAPRGVPVYYRVSAVDRRGNESPLSGPAPLIAEDTEPPGAVADLAARVNEEKRSVRLTWMPPGDADVAGYYVYSGADREHLMRLTRKPVGAPGQAEAAQAGAAQSGAVTYTDAGYADRGLEPGKSLVYAVSAVDNSFNEGPQVTAEAFIPDNFPPDPPFGLAARPTREGPVRLTWQPLLDFDLAGYRVYRSPGRSAAGASREASQAAFEVIHEAGTEARSWVDEEIERGRLYRYYLTGVDKSGNESAPGSEADVVPTDVQPPAPPAELTAEIRRRGVWLRWEPPADEDIRDYRIYRSSYPGSRPRERIATVDEATEYLDPDGRGGLVYAVSAVDTSANEGEKREVTAE